MLLHVCDRCRQELDENNTTIFKDYELCESCADRLTEYVTKGAPKEKPVKGVDWHDMKLGMPTRAGVYLLTIDFGSGDVDVRFGKYAGGTEWLKNSKNYGLINEFGGEVTAWAEMPDPYTRRQ